MTVQHEPSIQGQACPGIKRKTADSGRLGSPGQKGAERRRRGSRGDAGPNLLAKFAAGLSVRQRKAEGGERGHAAEENDRDQVAVRGMWDRAQSRKPQSAGCRITATIGPARCPPDWGAETPK